MPRKLLFLQTADRLRGKLLMETRPLHCSVWPARGLGGGAQGAKGSIVCSIHVPGPWNLSEKVYNLTVFLR